MARRCLLMLATMLILPACGGGGGGSPAAGGGGGHVPTGGAGPGGGLTASDTSVNAARVADLNALRQQCGGTALATVAPLTPLVISALKHAGWMAQNDAKIGHSSATLNHMEPDPSLSLYVNDTFFVRIEIANGGADIAGWNSYDEDIASMAGTPAINSLWNTVYHRIAMMRTQVTSVGYGDMALARTDYPAAGIPASDPWGNSPAGNGYATLDFTGYANPAITTSWWPMNGLTGVPKAFLTTSESPNPLPAGPLTTIGSPLHLVAPTLDNFTSVAVSLATGGTHVPVHLIVGGAAVPGTVSGDAVADTPVLGIPTGLTQNDLNPGEIFILPLPPGNVGLAASTTYTWSITAVDSSAASFSVGPFTFTTGP
jgi:hypothetical protein